MRRLTLLFAFICAAVAFVFASYGYYIIVRSPGAELSVIEFISKAVSKILRLLTQS